MTESSERIKRFLKWCDMENIIHKPLQHIVPDPVYNTKDGSNKRTVPVL